MFSGCPQEGPGLHSAGQPQPQPTWEAAGLVLALLGSNSQPCGGDAGPAAISGLGSLNKWKTEFSIVCLYLTGTTEGEPGSSAHGRTLGRQTRAGYDQGEASSSSNASSWADPPSFSLHTLWSDAPQAALCQLDPSSSPSCSSPAPRGCPERGQGERFAPHLVNNRLNKHRRWALRGVSIATQAAQLSDREDKGVKTSPPA